MYVYINGINNIDNKNLDKIINLLDLILKNINDEITLFYCGLTGIDLVNLYLSSKNKYNLECLFPCKYNIINGTFEDDNITNMHNKFKKETDIDSLNLIHQYMLNFYPTQKRYSNKYIYEKCDYLLSFTDFTDEEFNNIIENNIDDNVDNIDNIIMYNKIIDNNIIKSWLNTKSNISKYHFNINQELNTNFKLKYDIIINNLQEIIGKDEIIPILCKKDLNCYWGTAPTNPPHIGYLIPLLKIAELVDANLNVTILIADLHAFLDNMKSPLDKIKFRSKYYIEIITSILEIYKVDLNKIKFVLGTEFQLNPKYTMDVYKLNNLISIKEAKHAGSETVKQLENPLMTNLLYPSLQALDEEYLNVDCVLTGNDQRKINTFSREFLPKLNYKKRIHLINPIVSGLSNTINNDNIKMSSSDNNSKIDLLETPKNIKNKINKAYCLEGDINNNSVLLLVKNLVFRILERMKKPFIINRSDKYGGNLIYDNFNILIKDYSEKKLHPADLKLGLSDFLINFLEPIRNKFENAQLQELIKLSYG